MDIWEMKILQLIIKSCDECPYNDWKCNHPTVKFSKRSENRNIATIPDWCPLSDMPENNERKLNDYI